MTTVTVTTTYLELAGRTAFRPAYLNDQRLQVVQSHEPLPDFYRFLYGTVGRDYAWTARLGWTDDQLRGHLLRSALTLLVLYVRGTPAGFIELDTDSSDPGTEVAYFGLFSHFHGRGLGKHLLSVGVARAFEDGAQRVWVHTCTLDGPHALANYRARGFVPFREETSSHQSSSSRAG